MTVHLVPPESRNLSPSEAFEAVVAPIAAISRTGLVGINASVGRIAATSIASGLSLPPYDQSAVDGYGVGTATLDCDTPVTLRVEIGLAAGDKVGASLRPGTAVRLATGAPVPPGVAAVAMREHCRSEGEKIVLTRAVARGANIRRRGEDVAAGSTLIEAGTMLDARHIAIMAAAGTSTLEVADIVRVGVISTGNELRPQGETLTAYQIHDANRPMLMGMLRAPWLEVLDGGIVRDDVAALSSALARMAQRADAIITSGGAMGSDTDHTAAAIAATGGTARQIRIAQRPGKPIIAGVIAGVPLIGLPGNTTAAMVNFMFYALPMLMARAGTKPVRPAGQPALAHSAFEHTPSRTDFMPARIVERAADGRPVIEQLSRGGSARLSPFVLADGLAELSPEADRIEAGDAVLFHPFRNPLST